MKQLKIEAFGPIKEADIHFADLTLLVGAQASGKSLFLQLLKLLIDKDHIRKTVEQFGYVWRKEEEILNLHFGEDMAALWHSDSNITFDNESITGNFLKSKKERADAEVIKNAEEQLFYIPAQRILSIADGRPKTFMEFDSSVPYVLRHFSETLRLLMQNKMEHFIFPGQNLLNKIVRDSINDSIFHNGKVMVDDRTGQKKFRMQADKMNIPFITWSAGQKEFMPLLLSFYCLSLSSKANKEDAYRYVVIEEPEMGLHPQAVKTVILQIIDLLSKNHKVIVSTHSPIFLEFAWAFNLLKNKNPSGDVLHKLFGLEKNVQTTQLLDNILTTKIINTFYFSRINNEVITKDITSLDANSEDTDIAEWGGISQFAGKAAEIVSGYFAD